MHFYHYIVLMYVCFSVCVMFFALLCLVKYECTNIVLHLIKCAWVSLHKGRTTIVLSLSMQIYSRSMHECSLSYMHRKE